MSICPIIDGTVLPTRQNGKTLPCANLAVENAKLRELVRGLVYATHPADRARLIADAAELLCELGVEV